MKKLLLIAACVVGMGMFYIARADFIITAPDPQNANNGDPLWIATGTQTSQAAIETFIRDTYGVGVLYKYDFPGEDPAKESGSFAASYETTYGDPNLQDEDFTITYQAGAPVIGDPVYLLVKDGNAVPAWYFYDVSAWNGIDLLKGQGFWPNQGGISHVSLYGVPDGGVTAFMLGLGVLGVGYMARRKS